MQRTSALSAVSGSDALLQTDFREDLLLSVTLSWTFAVIMLGCCERRVDAVSLWWLHWVKWTNRKTICENWNWCMFLLV